MTALVRLSEKFGACIDGEKLSMQRCKDAKMQVIPMSVYRSECMLITAALCNTQHLRQVCNFSINKSDRYCKI